MKKWFLPFLLLAVLASCIPVDDWGAYWDKGVVDGALAGKWKIVLDYGKKPEKDKGILIAAENGNSRIDSLDEEEKSKPDYAPVVARTLKAGGYTYLMAGVKARDGGLVRYAVKDSGLEVYSLNGEGLHGFLKEKYSGVKNIGTDACQADCKGVGARIGTLDDAVFNVLSMIPDTQSYWTLTSRYERMESGKPASK